MTNYIPELYDFLREVGARQDREWFKAHKGEFDHFRELWYADIDRLINLCSEFWPELRGQTGKGSTYRIYRDTRFSLNKAPFKNYFSASLSPRGRSAAGAHLPGYYFQVGPGGYGLMEVNSSDPADGEINNVDSQSDAVQEDNSGLYGGIWCPESPILKKIRKAIVDNIEEFEEIITEPTLVKYFPTWEGSTLKTVPKGYDRNHPQAALLRLKDYGRYEPQTMSFFANPDWPEEAAHRFRVLYPLIRFLEYTITEE